MSTRQTWAHNLARRARLIHWPVESTDDGYKIKCPDGLIVYVHLTASDVNAEHVTMRKLKDAGFEEAEAALVKAKQEHRNRRNAEEQEANKRDLERAERHAAALRAAAGTKNVPIEDLINPHPVPRTFERVLVTPAMAERLLEINTDNRPIRTRDVNYWADIIESGRWLYTHQGIAVDNRGVLQDGQHRLSAIVATGQSVELQISVGMPVENFPVIDTGTKRSYGDVLYRRGIPNRNKIASVARTVILFKRLPNATFRDRVSNDEIDEFVGEHGEEIWEAHNRAQAVYNADRVNVTAAGVFIYLLTEQLGADHPKVVEFVEGLIQGFNLSPGDPRAAIRRQAISRGNRRGYVEHLALLIIGWNKWLVGKSTQQIAWRPSVQEFPKLKLPAEEEVAPEGEEK